jgi:hypothetical protein
MSSPIYAANSFIISANERGLTVNHLKTQKLVYDLGARKPRVSYPWMNAPSCAKHRFAPPRVF